ncbi:MAG: hypothetical protein QF368_15920 [SAR202 cluster bacterium]|nr:hypothetical protein [SAR202 cluster bacterium]
MLIGSSAESAASKPLLQDGPTVRAALSASSHISYPFTDDVENLSAGFWTADSPWDRTTDDSHSANTSWTDSPSDFYGNSVDSSLTLASPIDLSSASTSSTLKFWHHYDLEPGFDFAKVEVSTSGASGPWTALATYSGSVTSPAASAASAKVAEDAADKWGPNIYPRRTLDSRTVEPGRIRWSVFGPRSFQDGHRCQRRQRRVVSG